MYTPIPKKRSEDFKSNYWEAYSIKLNRNVNFFGDLRYEYWLLVETNPEIISFCERPIKIEKVINGKKEKTYIDMWLKWNDGREMFVKVVYTNKSNHPLRSIEQSWCQENGIDYLIITDKDIRTNSVNLANSKHLVSSLPRRTPSEIDILKIKKLIGKEKTTINKIFQQLLESMPLQRLKEALFWMIYQGKVRSNIDKSILNMETEVWINDET